MAQIDEAITAVMREVGAIGKTQKNAQQGFMYRSIVDVYNRIQPLMTKHGIYSVPRITSKERTQGTTNKGGNLFFVMLSVEYTFRAQDGSSVVLEVPGEGMDSGDKASNKAMAAAHKIAITQLFNIPYDVIDPDAFTPDWVAESEGRISPKQFKELKTSWWATAKNDLKDDADRVAAFRDWVMETTGAEDFMVENFREWTADDLAKCRKRLAEEAASVLSETGLTAHNGGSK